MTASMAARVAKSQKYESMYNGTTITMHKVGNHYESYGNSAEVLHDVCNMCLIYYGTTPYTDMQPRTLDWVLPKLVREGYKIAIFD